MSEIIFWRHAEAVELEDGQIDLDRRLSSKGQRQAEFVAAWLDRNLPQHSRMFVSEAKRAQQTARYLQRKSKTLAALNPSAAPLDVLAAIPWATREEPIVVVGHQSWIGECIHLLLHGEVGPLTVRKGAAWWLQSRKREEQTSVIVRAVTTPELR